MDAVLFVLQLINIAYVFVEWQLFSDDLYLNALDKSRMVCLVWGVVNMIMSVCAAFTNALLMVIKAGVSTVLCIIVTLCIRRRKKLLRGSHLSIENRKEL